MSDKKFYWLMMPKEFFKRHDIRIIESTPDGHEIILFYLKLMLESIDHNGELRFSEDIPYNPEMLATITDTDIEIVHKSIKVLEAFKLLEELDNGTYILPKVMSMIKSASDTAEARRQRRCREAKNAERDKMSQQSVTSVTDNVTNSHDSNSNNHSNRNSHSHNQRESNDNDALAQFEPPTVEEVDKYCQERHNNINPQLFVDYYTARGWKNIIDWKSVIRAWENRERREDF